MRPADAAARIAELEEELARLRQGLVQSHKLATLGTLSGIIAHEYNNLMTPVMCYAQMALANMNDAELVLKALQRALGGAEQASKICESLLGFARNSPAHARADLRSAVEEALVCLARPLSRDGIELVLDLPDIQLAIDPISLQQVFLNLLLNARKALKGRSGRITIGARIDGDYAWIDVADDGPGIPESIRQTLFEPFITRTLADSVNGAASTEPRTGQRQRKANPRNGATKVSPDPSPESSTPDDASGTGLGLTVCHDLITTAGGTISVTSQPDEGATFHIRLPVKSD
ncbi:MAG: hypothetical protein JJU36_07660 [Phycisphaeraceae bacterium]|nr:hypothetical protein [Phycisphaeraceae bacterium]